MSSDANPIDPARFALALESLPVDALYAKVAEIKNSIAHLKSSNEQMMPFADEGDQDCKEAMFENLSVIGRMNERISLIKNEVEGRGMMWGEMEDGHTNAQQEKSENDVVVNGDGVVVNGTGSASTNSVREPSGRLTDDELRRRLEATMDEDGDGQDDDGIHL